MKWVVVVVFVFLLRVDSSFHSAYLSGVSVYESGLWSEAISLFHSSRTQYLDWKISFVACKRKCGDFVFPEDDSWTVGPWTDVQEKAKCSLVCSDGMENPRAAADPFVSRHLYHYLQYAYYMEGKIEQAAAATYTYLEANPGHAVMTRNLGYYQSRDDVSPDSFVSQEPDNWLTRFLQATDFYENTRYDKAVETFEEALKSYYEAVDVCLLSCQNSVNTTLIPGGDMSSVIAGVYKSVLQCRVRCPVDMSYDTRNADKEDYEAMHFHYLQFSYYQLNRLTEAAASAMTYLEMKPDDETMINNLKFYESQTVLAGVDLSPRNEIRYHRSLKKERQLLALGGIAIATKIEGPQKFGSQYASMFSSIPKQQFSTRQAQQENSNKQNLLPSFREDSYHASINKWTINYDTSSPGRKRTDDNIEILLPPAGQESKERVVAEHLITSDECRVLLSLAKLGGIPGDGYQNNPSPHTRNERFIGLTILKAAELANEGQLDVHGTHLYYDVTERSRAFTEKYFKLNSTLYFSYTHLVCRSSLLNKGRETNELSHPVHSDNCLIRANGSICDRVPPAYTKRDYSGVLYLNDEFDGGNFFWAHRNLTVDTTVRPTCGRLVAFAAGDYHGVTGVNSGTRCAVALWFTLDPDDDETGRLQARDILNGLTNPNAATHSEL